eukprot:6210181-Pleurochrysis_carterae.AAC.2
MSGPRWRRAATAAAKATVAAGALAAAPGTLEANLRRHLLIAAGERNHFCLCFALVQPLAHMLCMYADIRCYERVTSSFDRHVADGLFCGAICMLAFITGFESSML